MHINSVACGFGLKLISEMLVLTVHHVALYQGRFFSCWLTSLYPFVLAALADRFNLGQKVILILTCRIFSNSLDL